MKINEQFTLIKKDALLIDTHIKKIISLTSFYMDKLNNKETLSFDEIAEVNKRARDIQDISRSLESKIVDNFNYIVLK